MIEYQRPGTLELQDQRFKLQIDPPALWANIRQALVSAGNTEFGGVADALLKGVATFATTNSPEHKAFSLLFNAMQRACVGVMTDRMEQRDLVKKLVDAGPLTPDFYRTMSQKISTNGYFLDLDFWQNPKQHPIVKDVQADYENFLTHIFQMHPQQAKVLSAALPARFVQALAEEWNRVDYSVVLTYFAENPFLETLQQQAQHDKRHADLQSRFAKPAFNDPKVTLAEMYIEPYCWIHGACLPEQKKHGLKQVEHKKVAFPYFTPTKPLGLHNYIADWLQGNTILNLPSEKSSLLVLLGQPGQGKTSFCLRTADQVLREQPGLVEQLYLLPLRNMTRITQLIENPLPIIIEELQIPSKEGQKGLSNALRNSLLLLDGLDELYMCQGLNMYQINNLIRNLSRQLSTTYKDLHCRVILTSRTHYLKLEDQQTNHFLVLHLAELNLDQQLDWLKRYKKHYNEVALSDTLLKDINDEKETHYKAIRELLNQPILLHLVAVSGVDLKNTLNAGKIYEDLFDLMIERKRSPEDGQLDKYKSIKPEDLRRFLQRLALYIFQSEHEHVKRSDFEKEDSVLKDAVEVLQKKMGLKDLPVQDLVKDLLVSFYFQETTRSNDKKSTTDDSHYAFEFLHKSLQEYLTAESIWGDCKYALLEKDQYSDYKINKWPQAMELIAPLFEKKIISQEIADYLKEIIQNDSDMATKAEVKQRLKALWPGLLNHQFLQQHTKEDTTQPFEKITGNFFGYWTLVSSLIMEHSLPLPMEDDFKKALQTAIETENLIQKSQKNILILMLLLLQGTDARRLDLRYQDLRGLNLCENLRGADLRGADLNFGYLSGTDLINADLRGANLIDAHLSAATLLGADLSGADLSHAELNYADLRDTDLNHAELSYAYLIGANLRDANLRFASLRDAYLIDADLCGADLCGADLCGADLSHANLSGANLSGAILLAANLSGVILDEVKNLEEALYLEKANFKGTIYEGKFDRE